MFYKIRKWILCEVIDPISSLYRCVYKNIIIFFTLGFVLTVISCVINPSIIFTPKKEVFVVYYPDFYMKSGRITSLIIKDNNRKNIINCAYFRNENGSFCDLYKPKRLMKVEGNFFSNSSLFFKDKKIVVNRIRFEDEKGGVIDFSTNKADVILWWNWIFFPTLLGRWLILFWFIVITLILFRKNFKHKNRI
ncbi:hypothetical protein OSH17_14245 [Acinetobacter baumannii]|uniref:hypothetical protein n=1 Tax=Acinetobacter baumannii TaxID=470 RepID=UPI00144AF0A6|nr:hypothetical protein [Acinetobacter baumannii]NLP56371.1 hypothetical protein [Acinetobacter baumannii]NQE74122.1 hypothetical protein [Acinetobacter baumannii]QNT87961.1 hypothetical protein H0N27_14165 [Acinetobacter baumannii]WEX34381.1 hypothetical protein OSH13_03335 [Acinetobacter baumannii]WEX37755.1 hypothetical protein OSH14_03335 [Acinetobacter baumannii]